MITHCPPLVLKNVTQTAAGLRTQNCPAWFMLMIASTPKYVPRSEFAHEQERQASMPIVLQCATKTSDSETPQPPPEVDETENSTVF